VLLRAIIGEGEERCRKKKVPKRGDLPEKGRMIIKQTQTEVLGSGEKGGVFAELPGDVRKESIYGTD